LLDRDKLDVRVQSRNRESDGEESQDKGRENIRFAFPSCIVSLSLSRLNFPLVFNETKSPHVYF
jgi:hypothetical protein